MEEVATVEEILKPVEEQLREAQIRNAQLAHNLAAREALLQQYEKERERAKSKGINLLLEAPIFNDDSSFFSETVRHKIHGGPPALGEVVAREFERLKVVLIAKLLESFGVLAEANCGGDFKLNVAVNVSSTPNSGPISLEMILTGERNAREAVSGGTDSSWLDFSIRSLGSPTGMSLGQRSDIQQ